MTSRAAIITVFHRFGNAPLIISRLLESSLLNAVIIANHNPRAIIPQDPIFEHPIVKIVSSEKPVRASARWKLAEKLQFDNFIVIDDDTSISGAQADYLFRALDSTPDAPCGVIGSRFKLGRYYDYQSKKVLNTYHLEETGEVDVLHQVYAVTKSHVDRFLYFEKHLQSFSFSDPNVVGEDIVISHCGNKKPMIYNLGAIQQDLPGAWDPAIAVHCEQDFDVKRARILSEFDKLNLYPIRCNDET